MGHLYVAFLIAGVLGKPRVRGKEKAVDTLSQAGDRFPGNNGFQRRQEFYLVEAGLYAEAADLGRDYLSRGTPKAEDYAATGTALRRSKSFEEALRFLETARLQFPEDGSIARALAQTTPLLIADEPIAGLDPASQIATMQVFRALAEDGEGQAGVVPRGRSCPRASSA